MSIEERRLGDRILHALNLALEQKDLDVAEHLARALESALTRFGGEGAVENRDLSDSMVLAFRQLDDLRRG
ncbi:hypothetical protein [Azospirillum sp. SYSU D00513]|uniref:hypothetical protein n=1 Tax=Azospirillum sp. SYSU D00513 TaxID=2812561 RepID=UPI001A96A4F8